jgi:diguanylate cyclase (GGDEF)-like protein
MRYFIFAFIVYELLFFAYFYNSYTNNEKEYYDKTIKLVSNSYNSTLNAYEMSYDDSYASQSDELSRLVHMANYASHSKRDMIRQKLLSEFMGFFNYKKLDSLNGFNIFDVEGKSLLRFHKPLHNDDNIIKKRYSLRKLQKELIYQEGFEVGIFQESYRFQYPLFYDGKFVGSCEYSVDSESLMNEMRKFYGDYYQLLFKFDFLENIIIEDIIEKNYKKIKIGSEFFYIKKYKYRKEIDKNRFKYIEKQRSLQNALHSTTVSVIEYKYDSNYYGVVVMPMKDIQTREFGYMLVHLNKSELHNFKDTFVIEMTLVTLFGFMLYLYMYKEIKNRRYVRELINLQHDLIIVSDGKDIKDTNTSFLNFFGYKTLKEFKKEHSCVCDLFIEEDGFLQEKYNELSWIKYIQENQDIDHKIKILNTNKEERIFKVEIEEIQDSHNFFILFRDITEELNIKVELEERANFDALTQIFNRSRFEFFLNKELEKADRYGGKFSLIMFDIDHFKEINDTYGHDAGDIVLKELTALVSSHTRDVDIFARWGGEEFMIISQTNIYQSEMFAEKLRQVIDENMFTSVKSVTCSFGVTQYKNGDTIESIVKRCDNMLYSAKESGRNCVASLK